MLYIAIKRIQELSVTDSYSVCSKSYIALMKKNPTIKSEKKDMQFIFATHNANIPVLSETETVIDIIIKVIVMMVFKDSK